MERIGLRIRLLKFFNRHPHTKAFGILLPCMFWIGVFFLLPLVFMATYSFLERALYGGVQLIFTWENYTRFVDPLYLKILLRSFRISFLTTVILLIIGYPMAYRIAMADKRWRNILLFLVVLPFWTSDLIRTYAWMLILRDTGLLNFLLQYLHVIKKPLTLLYTEGAILLGLAYVYLPFMVLPLYASIEKLDRSLLEAAEDLGATPFWRFLKVTVPLTKSGILAGSLLVFIPSVGAFIVPDLLGGAKAMMIGNLVQLQFGPSRNWPFGSAASFILMTIVLLAVFTYLRFAGGKEAMEEAR
ncbi:MAG: ABC transporter permease subunit [Proteobacteria bacterium]|nr:ABC transporter permease subunit [Pseudomonadota bacterium]NIS71041.1 ABC transporter permease subunit [Pseudomonadota bacterium]